MKEIVKDVLTGVKYVLPTLGLLSLLGWLFYSFPGSGLITMVFLFLFIVCKQSFQMIVFVFSYFTHTEIVVTLKGINHG